MDTSTPKTAARFQDIAPHIILSPLLFLIYFPPPFRFRGLLALLIISLAAWRATVSPWPRNEGDTQAMRYGLSCAWIHYLPVIERLLLHTPEREFFRVSRGSEQEREHPLPPPAEYSFAKLCWALDLFAAPRGVGWNIGGSKFSHPAASAGQESRARSVARRLGVVLACYTALDAAIIAFAHIEIPTGWARDASTLGRIAWVEVLMFVTVYSSMTMQYEMAAAVAIMVGVSESKDWPPLFGSIVDCYTVANVWGKFWHQYLRQACLGFSRALAFRVLKVPRRSMTAYFIHLGVAFLISALVHTLSLGAVRRPSYSLGELVEDVVRFFLLQAAAIIIETLVLTHLGINSQRMRWVGYVWVACWFYGTGWWLVKAYLGVGMAGWHPPFELLPWLA